MNGKIYKLFKKPKSRLAILSLLGIFIGILISLILTIDNFLIRVIISIILGITLGAFNFINSHLSDVNRKEINLLKKQIKNIEFINEENKRYASQSEFRLRDDSKLQKNIYLINSRVAEISKKIDKLQIPKEEFIDSTNIVQTDEIDLFAPNSITPSILERKDPAGIGREAAAVETDPRREVILRKMLGFQVIEEDKQKLPGVSIITCNHKLLNSLAKVAHVEQLMPSMTSPSARSAYIVIDLSALRSGIWSGTLESYGTSLYRSFADKLTFAKQSGKIVIILDDNKMKGNFGFDLESRSDLIISSEGIYSKFPYWSNDISTPIIDVLKSHIKYQNEMIVNG